MDFQDLLLSEKKHKVQRNIRIMLHLYIVQEEIYTYYLIFAKGNKETNDIGYLQEVEEMKWNSYGRE